MIRNDDELAVTRQQRLRVESAVFSIYRDVFPANPRTFALMAESYLDTLHELRADIDAYLGVSAAEEAVRTLLDDGSNGVEPSPASHISSGHL